MVGGRPGSGKSSLLRSVALDAAGRREVPLAFVSSPAPTEEAVMRMMGASGGIRYSELLAADLEERQWARLIKAVGILARAPIYWIDTPGLAIDELELRCRELVDEYHIEAVFIDSLLGLEGSGCGEDRRRDVEEILRSLDRLARELDLAVVMGLHIDERCELRPDKRPFPAELRHAQIVEDIASMICVLYLEREVASRSARLLPLEVAVTKHSEGVLGRVTLSFDAVMGEVAECERW